MNKAIRILVLFATLGLTVVGRAHAADVQGALRDGLKALSAHKGDPGLCTITDASYVRVDGKTSEGCVDLIQQETGCSVGQGNLLFFHRHTDYPLKIALFYRDTAECAIVSYDGHRSQSGKFNIGINTVTKPGFWTEPKAPLGPDTFTIVALANAWAAGAPYDLLKCVEFHDHFCPGITAGYMIARYITKQYPLKDGDAYTWIASPPWCKEDAIQVLLDLTPGKRNLYAQGMTESQKKDLKFENPAGILLISHGNETSARAVVFAFDWDKVRKEDKLEMLLEMISQVEAPEKYVQPLKEMEVTPEVVRRLTTAETNPYQWLGLTK